MNDEKHWHLGHPIMALARLEHVDLNNLYNGIDDELHDELFGADLTFGHPEAIISDGKAGIFIPVQCIELVFPEDDDETIPATGDNTTDEIASETIN